MIEPSYDDFRQNFAVAAPNRLRSIFPVLVSLVVIVAGGAVLWQFYRGGFSGSVAMRQDAVSEFAPMMREPPDTLQQPATDQVQALQQDLAAQQAQTRRLADEVDALSSKINSLQQSFASAQTTVGRAPPPRKRPVPVLPTTAPLSIRP